MAKEHSLIGKMLDGRYEVKALLGKGGMALVFRAHQPSMGRDVAIKVILPDVGSGPDFVQRFKQEAQIVARLEHPHILPVYDFGDYNGQAYLVMRLLDAGDLQSRLKSEPLSLDESIRLIGQLASALSYAHQEGIVHRDLKPQNVLMDSAGNPYLTDFGIAKAIGADSQMTATGTIMGTPAYMAPEQWRTEPVDARTDIYALGILSYVMLTGAMPFESETPFGLMYLHLDAFPEPLEARNSKLPPSLTGVIFRAIAKRPEERFQSAVDFARALEQARQNPDAPGFSVPILSGDDTEAFITLDDEAATDNFVDDARTMIDDPEGETFITPPPGALGTAPNQRAVATRAAPTTAGKTAPTLPPRSETGGGLPLTWLAAGLLILLLAAGGAFLLLSGGDNGGGNGGNTPTAAAQVQGSGPSDTPALEDARARVTATRGILYSEPNTRSEEVSVAPEESELLITGVSPDGTWYRVEFLGDEGWMLASQLNPFGNLAEIALVLTDTPTPTDSPEPPTSTPTDSPEPPTDTPTATDSPEPTATDTATETATPTETPTATNTRTPTPSDTASPTPTDTLSPTPTDTDTPTSTPTLTDARGRVLAGQAPLYEAPDATSRQLTFAPQGEEILVTGVTPDESWYEVQYLGVTGWVFAQQLEVFGNLETISVRISPTPTPSDTPTLTPTLTPSNTPTVTPTLTFTPSPTPPIGTAVPCVLTVFTANSREVPFRSLPTTRGESQILQNVIVGEVLAASARTVDGWYLTPLGWVFQDVVDLSSPFICGNLPIINIALTPDDLSLGSPLCEVLTAAEAALHRGASFGTVSITSIPGGVSLPVYDVARGEGGRDWYQVLWTNPDGVLFQGWVITDLAGPVAGSCPAPEGSVSLFGNPYINPLNLESEPSYSAPFDSDEGYWSLLAPGSELVIDEGFFRLTVPPRSVGSFAAQAPALNTVIDDAYITAYFAVPPGFGEEEYFLEIIVRGYYVIRISNVGQVVVVPEGNPSLILQSTADGALRLDQGVTLGILLQGPRIAVYANGAEILALEDNSRAEGTLLRFRASNRDRDESMILFMDDFAYWDLSE